MKFKQLFFITLFSIGGSAIAGGTPITFEDYDRDGDGFISKKEAAKTKELNENWGTADKDKDNRLDISEFSAFEGAERFTPPEESEVPELGSAPFKK